MIRKLLAIACGTGLAMGLMSLTGCDNKKPEPNKSLPAGHTVDDGHDHSDGEHHEGDGHTHENETK